MYHLKNMPEYHTLIDEATQKAQEEDFRTRKEKRAYQKVIEEQATKGKGYVRLPYDEGIFSKVDPIKSWIFLAYTRDIFNETESGWQHYNNDKVSVNTFMADERMKKLLVYFEDYLTGKSFSHLKPKP